MINSALYYPNIEISCFAAPQIKAMSLLYDKIYRIVPNNIPYKDCEELLEMLTDGSVIKNVSPDNYKDRVSKKFLKLKDNWGPKIISYRNDDSYFSRLHIDKINDSLRGVLHDLGINENDNFLNVPAAFLDSYMSFLAKEIAVKNNLQLATEHWAPWTATTFFNLGECFDESLVPYNSNYNNDPFALYSLIISEIIPININEIPVDKILTFREKRFHEIKNFRNAIFELHDELQNVEELSIRKDVIDSKIVIGSVKIHHIGRVKCTTYQC